MRYILITLALFLAACSPQKKLDKLYNKHPEVFNESVEIRHDTIEIVREQIRIDEIEVFKTDTISYTDSVMTYQIVRLKGDTVHVRITVKPDTVRVPYVDTVSVFKPVVNTKAAKAQLKAARKKARRWGFIIGCIVGSLAVLAIWKRKQLLMLLLRLPLPF